MHQDIFTAAELPKKPEIPTIFYYPEYYLPNLTMSLQDVEEQKKEKDNLPPCAKNYVRGKCDKSSHYFAKAIICGREYCQYCGKDGSIAHQRRISRWMPKVMQTGQLGYLVVTVPEILREKFMDRKTLIDFRTFNKRKLQRLGYLRGLIRYHWAGDCSECKNKKGKKENCLLCQGTGASSEYKPHLNILIEEGYLEQDKSQIFAQYKKSLAAYFNTRYKKFLQEEAAKAGRVHWQVAGQLHYNYCKENDTKKKMHRVRYITRATMKFYKSDVVRAIGKKFRTTSSFGHWDIKKWNKKIKYVIDNAPALITAHERKVTKHKVSHNRHIITLAKQKEKQQGAGATEKEIMYFRIKCTETKIKIAKERTQQAENNLRSINKFIHDAHRHRARAEVERNKQHTHLELIEKNLCPICKSKIRWQAGAYEFNFETNKRGKYKHTFLTHHEVREATLLPIAAGYYSMNLQILI